MAIRGWALSLGLLALSVSSASAVQVPFVQNAVNDADGTPISAVSSNAWLETALTYTTVTAPTISGSYHFTHWSCTEPTAACRDAWGRSINPISVPLYEDTTATAHYLPTARDSDSDGIPDWYEMEYFGTITNEASADMDGDGKTLAQEYSGATDDRFANTRQAGGVSFADSEMITCNLAGYPSYTIRSEPAGTVSTNGIVLPGTVVTTPNMTQSTFGYWTFDGVRQADASGVSLRQISFQLQSGDHEAVAYLFTGDGDSDGVADAWEAFYYGTMANGADSDTDGDGFTMLEEYAGNSSPLVSNFSFTIRSIPAGTVNTNAIVLPGLVVTTSNMTQNTFGYWTLDGTRQADAWGVAIRQVTFTVDANREAIAYMYTGDPDGDGVPDAWEMYYYGTTANGAASDTDGDGLTLLAEYTAGSCPIFPNAHQAGGVSWADSELVGNYHSYTMRSVPAGVVDTSAVVWDGTIVTTTNMTQASFGYWTLDGTRQQDAWGVAYRQLSFTVLGADREAVAYLISGDADADGIPDAWEIYYYGTTDNDAASDTDGDGRTMLDEYTAASCPLFGNFYQAGGVSWADSDFVLVQYPGFSRYAMRSVPPGTVDQFEVVPDGTTVNTPNMTQTTFGYWALDGTRQADAWGVAIRQFSFVVDGADRDAVAYMPSGDSDGDGVADAWELYHLGTTNWLATGDPDGDGKTLLQEFQLGLSPVFGNFFQPGGISWMDSDLLRVNLQLNDRPEYLLVNGVQTHFFSRFPTNSTGMIFGPDTHPALGDWNGDGTVDLFVAAGDGVLRVFENTGSPSVPNLVERTTNFAAWAWAGITNPAIALGDWSGDGKADLVVGGDTGTLRLLASTGDFGGQPATLSNTLAVASARTIPALADLSGDGCADLLVLLADGTVNLYTNTGNALAPFAPPAACANPLGTAVPDATGLAVATTTDSLSVLVSDAVGRIWEFLDDGALHFTLKSKVYGGAYSGFANGLTLASADFDGDGDPDLIGGFAEGGLVYMQNRLPLLLIDPPLATVVAGQDVDFETLNASGATQWSLVRNSSGGSLVTNSGAYTAGAGRGMDVIEAMDATGLRGRAYVNVIGASEVASFGKAIVVGGGKDLADPVWLATDYIASRAYNVLRYKGYSRENIHYLSFDPWRDVDGDGLDNDIAGFSSHANVAGSFTNWTGNANRLLVYLVDHGSATPDGAYFRLNAGENLTSTQLDAWLDAIQDEHGTEVVVVLDFCYAGRFLEDLAYAGPAKRVVIAATSPGELTYFLSGGLVSFSDLFLSGLLQGLDLEQAFLFAREGMEDYQNGTLDDDGDGAYQAGVDGSIAAGIPIGATHLAGKDVPVIGSVAPNQTLNLGTKASLWAEAVESYYPIDRVYCTIIPPSFSASTNAGVPVTAMSEVELTPQAGGRYAAEVDRFAEPGLYRINYYARDIWGSVSPPRQGLVTQAGFDERMAIVAGGATNDPGWRAISRMASTAYQTALARRLNKSGIRYLSAAESQDLDGDGTNDVHAAASAAALSETITGWAAGANRLTVCLLGTTTSNAQYRIGAAETLPAADLDGWLDAFQASNAAAVVVLDFDGCGGYVPALAPPEGKERIVVASTKAGAPSVRAADGLISFSQFFLSGVFNGRSLGAAFADARNAIRYASGRVRQTAQLDDSGNGVPDEKKLDGLVAAGRYLGAAFATGEDTPSIGSVIPPTNLVQGTPLTLWAASVLSGAGISNVWCAITPPDYDGLGELPQTNLAWSALNNRYEAPYADFTLPGDYALTFYALDSAGQLSAPVQSSVTATDAYEPDDTNLTATIFVTEETQAHNLHAATDEDWVMFYAPTGFAFNVDATQLGDSSDLVLDIYYEWPSGELELIEHVDDPYNGGTGSNVIETTYLDLKTGTSGLEPGIYLVRVSSADTNLFGPGSEYELKIYEPVGGAGGVNLLGYGVSGFATLRVTLGPQEALAADAAWKIDNLEGDGWHSNNDTTYILPIRSSGSYRMIFRDAAGFTAPEARDLDPDAGQTLNIDAAYAATFSYTNPVPQFVSMSLDAAGGVFQFQSIAKPGNRYAIEQSTNLIHWTPLGTNLVPSDGALPFSITNDPSQPRAFYRWRLVE